MMHSPHFSALLLAALLAALSPLAAVAQAPAEPLADAPADTLADTPADTLGGVPAEIAAEATAADPSLGVSTEPLALQGGVTLTQGEIDAAFSRIRPEHRLLFIRSGERVDQLIRSLLQNKIMAEQARQAGFDQEPVVSKRVSLAGEKELAEAWIERVMEQAPDADYEALAYERYLANPEPWMSAEMVDVTHLLISSDNKSAEKALELAQSLRARLDENPGDFDALVAEFSEDPSKNLNKGRFPAMTRGQMVEPFEAAAFSLANEGEISQPVQTDYGYHIIRLNRKIPPKVRPFEVVREEAIEQARKSHLDQYRKNYMLKHLSGTIEIPPEAVEAMAKRYFGENLEHAPKFEN
jgi:peptidyl-prolyl cis-trans isomerase C